MSDFESARINKEAVDSVAARPPREPDPTKTAATRRYLGIALFETLKRRQEAARKQAPPKAKDGGEPDERPEA